MRRTGWRRVFALMLVGLVALNAVAWMQAWTMTHYTSGGQRTARPEALSLAAKAGAIFTGVSIPKPSNAHTPGDIGLTYRTHLIPVARGGLLEAWYIPHAEAKGIVLMFPGYAESKESLLPAAAALNDIGHELLLVDFQGTGGSSGHDTTLGVREATDVAAAMEYSRRTWPRRATVLYGVSMGGAAVLRAVALEGVQPDALILESPFDTLLHTVRNRFHAMGLPAFPGAELLVFWGSVQQGFNGFALNPVDYASAARCPVLLLHGEQDPRVTGEQARAIYERLGGRKEFVSFPGAAHESLVNTAPETWNLHVARFLN